MADRNRRSGRRAVVVLLLAVLLIAVGWRLWESRASRAVQATTTGSAAITPSTSPAATAPAIGEYYIGGGIPRPGAYMIDRRTVTARQAAVAAGLTREAALSVAYISIYRRSGKTGEESIKIDAAGLFERGENDEPLRVDDQVMVVLKPGRFAGGAVIDAPASPDRRAAVRVPRPLTLLSILSVLLFGATAVDEHRSRTRADGLLLQTPWVTVGWSSSAAKVELRFVLPREGEHLAWNLTRRTFNRRGDLTPPDNMRLRGGGLIDWRVAGVTFQGGELYGKFAALTVPHVVLITALSVLPARWIFLRARRSHYLRLRGLCGRCGYDLRASTSACPECGESIPVKAAAAAAAA